MFSNLILFIIALLSYNIYQPLPQPEHSLSGAVLVLISHAILFWGLNIYLFRRIEKIALVDIYLGEQKFSIWIHRLSILAILFFAFDIYGLHLPSFFFKVTLFKNIPTLLTACFIGLFTGYMIIIWHYSYEAYQKIFKTRLKQGQYISSNLSFALPAILPWFIYSLLLDIISVLPFRLPKEYMAHPEVELVFFIFFIFCLTILVPLLLTKIWGCTPLEATPQRQHIEALCTRAHIGYADILKWPIFGGTMMTAGVMGIIRKFRYILVTSALLKYLETEELTAVIAHEIGHVKKLHMFYYLIMLMGFMGVSYTLTEPTAEYLLNTSAAFWLVHNFNINYAALSSVVYSTVVVTCFLLYFRYAFGYFMRNFERQADLYVYTFMDTAKPLIATFTKIAITSGQSSKKPNWHHFSIDERINYLKKCEENRDYIKRQDHKIKKSLGVYVIIFLLLGTLGYHLNYGQLGKTYYHFIAEKRIDQWIQISPKDPDILYLIGNLYYQRQNFEKALSFFEKALQYAPDHPEILNSIAWLYATCEDPRYLNYEMALTLAQKAVQLSRSPHILDTLAEGFFRNKMFAEAVKAEEEALSMNPEDRSFYEKKLQTFKTILNKSKHSTSSK